jgi:dGTPase
LDHNVIGYSTTMLPMNKELKSFLFKNLYNHPRVRGMAEHARNALITIYRAYVAKPEMLPPDFQAAIPSRGLERAVCDYIAGMTDRFAEQENNRLKGTTSLP